MHELIYVFDAYCGWCYGFGPALLELEQSPDVTITVRHGSLFSGANSAPIGQFGHIPAANERIGALTGVPFGDAYQALLAEGTLLLESDAAAHGLTALRRVGGESRALELAEAMQTAFYRDGRSLSSPETYAAIATAAGLDPAAVADALRDPATAEQARAEQAWSHELGVHSYPTLLLQTRQGLQPFGSPLASASELRALIEKYAAA